MIKHGTWILLLSLLGLASCGGTTSSKTGSSSSGSNQAPSIHGYQDSVTLTFGKSWNALEGVSASDPEDGDLTDKITLSVDPNDLGIAGGLITGDLAGEYLIKYSVSDTEGLSDTQWTTLTVSPKESEGTLLKQYATEDLDSWSSPEGSGVTIQNEKAGISFAQSAVSASASTAKRSLGYLTASSYRLELGLSSDQEGLSLSGEVLGNKADWTLTMSLASYSLDFTVTEAAAATLTLSFPTSVFSIALSSLKLTDLSKTDSLVETSFDPTGYALRLDKNATASLVSGEGYVGMDVSSYPDAGNNWALGFAKASTYAITSGTAYTLSITLDVRYAQYYEFMVQPNVWGPDDQRTAYQSGTLVKGVNELSLNFTADKSVANAFFEFYLGTDGRASGENENQLLKLTAFTLTPSGAATGLVVLSKDYMGVADPEIALYNSAPGAGTLFYQEGHLVYDITAFGASDWMNKVQFKNVVLTSVATYRFSFVVSATSALKFGFYVSPTLGEWNPVISDSAVAVSSEATKHTYTFAFGATSATSYDLFFQFGGNSGTNCVALSDIIVEQLA